MCSGVVVVAIDILMFYIYFIIGVLFIRSKGEATRFLSGYKSTDQSKEEKEKLCFLYGRNLIYWAGLFAVGAIIDTFCSGIGMIVATVLNIVLLIRLLLLRHILEK